MHKKLYFLLQVNSIEIQIVLPIKNVFFTHIDMYKYFLTFFDIYYRLKLYLINYCY